MNTRVIYRLVPAFLAVAIAGALPAGAEPLSPRNANYEIEAQLDPETREVTGRQVLTWRNVQDEPTDQLWFHLYWNGFRNDRSTWLQEDTIRGRSDIRRPKSRDWGYLEVEGVRLVGEGPPARGVADAEPSDLEPDRVTLSQEELPARYAAPDDGNPDDRTVLVVDLPRQVAPGETIQVELDWKSKVPRTFARTGHRGEFYFMAHWFPKLGVFEGADGWNCHQFHSATEFFSDYGNYDVELTLPDRFVLGATGREAEKSTNGDGTTTYRYQQEDVHGFAWTASPDYLVKEERFEEPGLPSVDMRLLYQGEHEDQVQRHFDATRAALKYYGSWYGPYPYEQITIVDPAYGSGAGGMEYPTLFTSGTRNSRPFGGGSPEGVTIHEAGHQFWYGIVGNNEFEFAWLDEGLNTFSTARAYAEAYGEGMYTKRYLRPPSRGGGGRGRGGGFITKVFPEVRRSRAISGNRWGRYVSSGANTADPQSTHTYLYYPGTAGSISYSWTALWLHTLERHLGWDTLQRILSTFFERYKFDHPRPEDLFAVANEVAGQDLGWYFDQVHGDRVDFDYAIESVKSRPADARGFVEGEDGEPTLPPGDQGDDNGEDDEDEADLYRSEVVVRRHGGGVFPLELLMVFEDGTRARLAWDGQERWHRFVEEQPSKLDYAVLDPERVLLLDLDYSNNSRRLESQNGLATAKWSSKWMVWLQDLLHTFTFFI